MATVIKIKGSQITSVPPTLAQYELAYSAASDKLFIHDGTAIVAIGGKSYTDKLDGIAANATAGATWSSDIANQPTQVSGGEITTGTETAERIWSPADVVSAISQHAPASDVNSVHGRTGAVVSAASDYDASQVDNDSSVAGAFVDDALNTLDSIKLDVAGGTMTGALTLSGAPSSDLHAATKLYVDAAVSGLDPKGAVRVSTTANITLSGAQTIDGVSVVATDRVLVKDQTDASENGIYVAAAGAWARSDDADNTPAGEVTQGMYTVTIEGTANAGFGFILTTPDPIVLDTTDLTFVQFASVTAPVSSVNGYTGAVVLDADDIAATATRIWFTTAEQTKLGGIEALATAGADWDVDVANKPVEMPEAEAQAGVATTERTITAAVMSAAVVAGIATIDGGTF